MQKTSVTRRDLCEAVYKKVGLSRSGSAALVELMLKEITTCLERGEAVKLSSFGIFMVRVRRPRVGRNPRTGETVSIPSQKSVAFKPSPILMQCLGRPQTG